MITLHAIPNTLPDWVINTAIGITLVGPNYTYQYNPVTEHMYYRNPRYGTYWTYITLGTREEYGTRGRRHGTQGILGARAADEARENITIVHEDPQHR